MKPQKKIIKKETSGPNTFFFYALTAYIILFIPVFHIRHALDQALMPRTMMMSAFVLIMAFGLLYTKYYSAASFSLFRLRIFPVLAGYLAVVLLSIVFAINYRESFFDIVRTFIFVSMVGIASYVFYRTEGWQEKLPRFVLVAAVIALAIGSWQYYNDVIKADKEFLPDGRSVVYKVYGLMFHKNEYSTALALMLPFIGYGIFRFKGLWRIASIVVAFALLVMIVLVETRAVWVGLMVAGLVLPAFAAIYARKLKIPILYRNVLIGLMVTGALAIGVILSLPKPKDQYSLLGRIRSITDTRSQHNIHRLSIWKSTIQLIKEHPLTGIGAGNWKLNVNNYFDGRFDQIPQLNWDRPHNDFLWVFSEKGIIGFILYLAIFGFAFYYLVSVVHLSPRSEDKILALLFIAGIMMYLAISFFGFPYERINHQNYLAIMIAGGIAMYLKVSPRKSIQINKAAIFIPLIVFSVFGTWFGYATTKQEIQLNKALSAYNQEKWPALLSNARLAHNPLKSLDPLSNPPEYYEGLALAKMNRHKEAVVAYEKAREQFPNNIWILNWMGLSYYHVGRYTEAIECIEKVIDVIPAHREAYVNLSATYYQMGDYKKSYESLHRYPQWQSDSAMVRNMRVLENLMGRQESQQQ